ncbi:MAG: hypothetical protein ACRD50_16795 [Candidatus Acidiferrales bacterium]
MRSTSRPSILASILFLLGVSFAPGARGQERPYFVTYDHQLEEPGNLEISFNPIYGAQRRGNDFLASWAEFEYGVTGWWTSEFYLAGQSTFHDGTVFTGLRWENRFRPLLHEHRINPVLYTEFEDINAADKTLLEVVGFDGETDHAVRNSIARRDHLHEIETKLILSSNFRGWNVSENFIAEKNFNSQPWEFGYAAGVSRPLALAASPDVCRFCRENFVAGLEIYGGLGTAHQFTLSRTSHYLAPVVAWQVSDNTTLRISPAWGLTGTSHRFLLRWSISYEIDGFGQRVRRWLK